MTASLGAVFGPLHSPDVTYLGGHLKDKVHKQIRTCWKN